MQDQRTDDRLIQRIDALHRHIAAAQRELLRLILEADRRELWRDSGARDLPHWLSMRHHISHWKARRWIAAAHALEELPGTAEAFSAGELGIDKVVELTRFAAPETEGGLIRWAQGVSVGCIRHRGDLAARQSLEDARSVEDSRSLWWSYFDEGRRFGLQAELPAADGAVVAKALERLAESLPVMPGEDDPYYVRARRADALVALCSTRVAADADPDRATVVVHARAEGLAWKTTGGEIERGPVIHPETVRRLACNGRLQVVEEDDAGQPVRLGRTTREPPPWMLRQLRYRDRECVFPGCGGRRWIHAHHIVWWRRGGTTDLDNLVLLCTFHHKLVHELGWRLRRERDGTVLWFRPDGRAFWAGRSPPPQVFDRSDQLVAAGRR